MLRRLMIFTVMALSMLVMACEPDTTEERIADNIEDVGEEMRDSAEDVGNEIEDACEEMKEEAGANDTNC